MTREIPLTRGLVALVDDEDYELVSAYKWHAVPVRINQTTGWYARHTLPRINGRKPSILMHKLIFPVSDGMETDHKDGNGLNNQRSNLREATHAQNSCNRRLRSDNTSGFRGVYRDKTKWFARIVIEGKARHLGYFSDPVEAARAYNAAALTHYGEFARLNPGV